MPGPAVLCPGVGDEKEGESEAGEKRGGEEGRREKRRGGEGAEEGVRGYQDTLEFLQEGCHISTLLQPLKGREREWRERKKRKKERKGRRWVPSLSLPHSHAG